MHLPRDPSASLLARFSAILVALCLLAPSASAEEVDDINAVFFAAYQTQCDLFLEDGRPAYPAEVVPMTYRLPGDEPSAPAHELRLYQYVCVMGAYNAGHVFFTAGEDGFAPLHFARPAYRVIYENGALEPANDSTPVEDIVVIGMVSDARLTNAEVDREAGVIRSHSLWRGIGDASSAGEWRLVDGNFTLVTFDVDPTYDGEANPVRIWDTTAALD